MEAAPFVPRGAILKLWNERKASEVLVDGPAGTGKSYGIAHYLHNLAESFPGCRILVFRKTRVSLTQSWMVTFEEKVLPCYPGAEYLSRGAGRAHRQEYVYANGSRIVLGGMDNPTRLFSTEYDIAYCNEATEIQEEEFESIHRALRNGVLPWQQLIGDCNPDAEFHWLNQRCTDINEEGKTKRLKSWIQDNPLYFDVETGELTDVGKSYVGDTLENLTGVRYDRLVLGKWVSAEGAVWGNFRTDTHVIDEPVTNRNGRWHVGETPIRWTFASCDWGFRNAGALQVWGVDADSRMYLLREWYHTQKLLDWWAEAAYEAHKKYDLNRIVCDPSQPGSIEKFNDRLGHRGGRDGHRIAVDADNDVMAGLDLVRDGLEPDDSSRPAIYICKGSLAHAPDEELRRRGKPTSLIQEIPSYVWKPAPQTAPNQTKDEPLKEHDHACDALRYAAMFLWGKDLTKPAKPQEYEGKQLGAILPTWNKKAKGRKHF